MENVINTLNKKKNFDGRFDNSFDIKQDPPNIWHSYERKLFCFHYYQL